MAQRRRKIEPKLLLIIAAVAVVFIAGIVFIVERYTPGKEYADLYELFGLSEDETAVFVDGERMEQKGILVDGTVYLPLELVNTYIYEGFYWSDENKLLFTLPTEVTEAVVGESRYMKDGKTIDTDYRTSYADGETLYVALDYVRLYAYIKVELYETPERLYITTAEGEKQAAVVTKDAKIREKGGIKSLIITDVVKDSTVYIDEVMEDWTKVTYQGFTGYIQNKYLGEAFAVNIELEGEKTDYSSIQNEGDVFLLWHQVFNQEANDKLADQLSNAQGATVISPTWFSLSDNYGNFTSLASLTYVETAHSKGMEVWALIDDFSTEVDKLALLSSTAARETLVANLMTAVNTYQLDGINIDFEGITEECGEHFIQFIRELSVACRKSGIVLSIDNYVPAGGRKWYHRAEQGKFADYVIVMGYDQHWSGSEPGSNATLSFTESGITDTMALVPRDKIIHALPFFMRVWQITNGVQASYATGMADAKKLLEDNNAEMVWLDEEGQYYGEYELDGTTTMIWLEDITSLELKMKLVDSYDIGGAAFWKLGLQSDDVWEMIVKYLN